MAIYCGGDQSSLRRRFRIIEIWNTANSDPITINVTGNANPDTVMQA
jgi:hypothetical protein